MVADLPTAGFVLLGSCRRPRVGFALELAILGSRARDCLGVPVLGGAAAVVAITYGWLTRQIRLRYVALGVFPTVWFFGMGLAIVTGGI